ncbi:phosphatidylglycerophosphatase A family protein [Coxiella endosymbiont of Amblyomma americanum]|uniref:phosphatidylglycerophosphatase A family protein n=1 Tax=Coxiella endosymbiont of Amblyomma americanum TaxID=325775 RepID=UPI000A02A1E4|nr:phosphatidylglycerophosphatase A [Coxiella endosymbiont of Amblyomma americanum]AUJ58589.1 hypothetical protein B1F76_00460 [Coxiella-like endosymbiont of Amblyomma americanum]
MLPFIFLCQLSPLIHSITTCVLFIFGVIICDITGRGFEITDHPNIVWDEMVGFLFFSIMIPNNWYCIAVGFILFRAFDIWKPWPIKWVERKIRGGWGIMIDDIIAALYARAVLAIIIRLVHLYNITAY